MVLERSRKNKKTNRRKRVIIIFFVLVITLLGFWFASSNFYKFAKGYFLYKSKPAEIGQMVSSEVETIEEKELYPVRPKIGERIGELYIPKLDATLPIYHGTDEDELEKGVGHYAGSVLPGEKDNSVLSGHRDTVFRKLGEVGKGDTLVVTTTAGRFEYRVNKVRIVDEDDRTVIVPKPRPTLTVTTCYPFQYIGSAPERYILVAHLISKKLN